MKTNSFNLKKRTLTVITVLTAAFFTMLPSFALENIISSVTISKAKDKPNAYELNIDSTETVSYKTNTDEDGSIYFDLKNSVAADEIATFYDDVANIDNVVVKQIGNNKVRIYVKGRNVKNTELVFANSIPDSNQKKVIINRPMNEYQSTSYDDLENEQDNLQAWDDNSFNLSHLGTSLFLSLKNSPLGVILIVLALIAIVAAVIRNISIKLSQDKEPLIGLNGSKYKTDISFDGVLPAKPKMNNDLDDVAKRNETIKLAQAQLARAHQKYQEYIQNKYKNANFQNKPKSIGIDPIKQGIALNQYQKSTKNPYLDQEVIKLDNISKQPKKVDFGSDNFKVPPKTQTKKQPSRQEFTTSTLNSSPYIQRKSGYEPKTFKKEGSMRFLESVTKIYEQSGRADLADELKNTIQKSKQII